MVTELTARLESSERAWREKLQAADAAHRRAMDEERSKHSAELAAQRVRVWRSLLASLSLFCDCLAASTRSIYLSISISISISHSLSLSLSVFSLSLLGGIVCAWLLEVRCVVAVAMTVAGGALPTAADCDGVCCAAGRDVEAGRHHSHPAKADRFVPSRSVYAPCILACTPPYPCWPGSSDVLPLLWFAEALAQAVAVASEREQRSESRASESQAALAASQSRCGLWW
jgi:hypothetical protein